MALVMCVKDEATDSFYIASDGIASANNVNMEFSSMRRYNIQKFKNFYVAWTGNVVFFQNLFNLFDFDSLSYPLTKEVIYQEFYPSFQDYLVEWGIVKPDENKCIFEFKEDIIFIQDGKAFDCTDVRIHEIPDFAGAGYNHTSYIIGSYFYGKKDAKELCKMMIEKEIETCAQATYPIYIVNSREDDMEIIDSDGTIKHVKMECMWGKEEWED